MLQQLALYVVGVLLAVVGFLLARVLRSVDDTNAKVTATGIAFAHLETSVGYLTNDVRSLTEWRQDVTDRALAVAEARALEFERRHGPPDRRESNG